MFSRRKTNNYLGRNFGKEREDDKNTKEMRSSIMSKIRSKGTRFELNFVYLLNKKTRKHFKLNVMELKGKPDIVFYKYNLCHIFYLKDILLFVIYIYLL